MPPEVQMVNHENALHSVHDAQPADAAISGQEIAPRKSNAGKVYIPEVDPKLPQVAPLEQPPFTIADLKKAIPEHCFERSYVKSFSYLAHDLLLIALLFGSAVWIRSLGTSFAAFILWPAYWVFQGAVFTGLWVLAHECGHQAFTPSHTVNNLIGLICHSALLVPYHPWRISHGKHHAKTNDMENDEVFVPTLRSEIGDIEEDPHPFKILLRSLFMFAFGWWGYLAINATGPKKNNGVSHFQPNTVLLSSKHTGEVHLSNAALVVVVGLLIWAAMSFSVFDVVAFYLIPLMVQNFWLVLITFLQHTDVYIPHYRGEEWNWLRGALCTVDRPMPLFFTDLFHNISDTHVCHHIFSKLPHYHAKEATVYLRQALGPYYLRDDRNALVAFWEVYKKCLFVEDEGGILFFKNKK